MKGFSPSGSLLRQRALYAHSQAVKILNLYERYGISIARLAERYGVSPAMIRDLLDEAKRNRLTGNGS